MALKTDVYVDTSAFIAFFDKSDSFHHQFAWLFAQPPKGLYTTQLVIAEIQRPETNFSGRFRLVGHEIQRHFDLLEYR